MQDSSHHRDYSIFRIRNPYLNLLLWLASWVGGGRPNWYPFYMHGIDLPVKLLVILSLSWMVAESRDPDNMFKIQTSLFMITSWDQSTPNTLLTFGKKKASETHAFKMSIFTMTRDGCNPRTALHALRELEILSNKPTFHFASSTAVIPHRNTTFEAPGNRWLLSTTGFFLNKCC